MPENRAEAKVFRGVSWHREQDDARLGLLDRKRERTAEGYDLAVGLCGHPDRDGVRMLDREVETEKASRGRYPRDPSLDRE